MHSTETALINVADNILKAVDEKSASLLEGGVRVCGDAVLRYFWCGFAVIFILKEQYPVTAHAPNFDFWTGCREIKRCEESKRTLKNPFASRLAEFNTTLKLLRITDQ